MTALMWQTALLLLGAYFLGAWLACMARRVLFAGASDAAVTVPAAPPAALETLALAPTPVADTEDVARFERALSGTSGGAAQARPASEPTGPLPTPPDRSHSGVSTMVETMRSRTEATPASQAAAADINAAAAAAVSRATTPPPGAPSIMPAAAGTGGRGGVSAPLETKLPEAPAPAPAPIPAAAAKPAVATGPSDDLRRIRGIDDSVQARLYSAGVRRYADIAAWKPEQVTSIAAVLGMPGRIERENWIEQAQILAGGGATKFSSQVDRGETAAAEPTEDEGERRSIAAAASAAAAAAAAAAASRAAGATPALVRALAPASTARDNLQRIAGINGEVERLLNVQGVQRYSQIAAWSLDDVAKFDRLLGSIGRIERESWIDQAKLLDRGEPTAFAREFDRRAGADAGNRPSRLADAIAARAAAADPEADRGRSDMSNLRSVKSEAYRPGESASGGQRSYDDLKRIRGVGVLIEKKLYAMGVTRYDQVASWTTADIERISDKLDFKGRIERENWVEQARILSAGGATEFSRRFDETSRS